MDHLTHPLNEGHKVLGEEDYCSGYLDPFGKWNNGFPCPILEENEPVFCCGTESLKYCCVNPKTPVLPPVPHLALLLGITFGIAVAVIVVVTVSCFHCSCCLLYKKRQPTTRGSVYQMHCPSSSNSTGGVANMYSFSGTTTPTDTPRSVSRASSSRSRFTSESGPSTVSYASYGLSDSRIRNDLQGHTYSRVQNTSRPGSIAFSDQSTSTLSDITVREMTNAERLRNSQGGTISLSNFEPPPPYTAAHSTLVAVRTSASNASTLPSYIPRPYTSPSLAQTLLPLTNQQTIQAPSLNHTAIHTQNSFQEPQFHPSVIGDTLNNGSQLRTFSQSSMPSNASSAAAIAALSVATRLPMMKSNGQLNQSVITSQDQPLSITQNLYTNMGDGFSNRIYANSEAVFKNQLQNALANNLNPGFINSQIRNKSNPQKYTLSQNIRAVSNLTYDHTIPTTTCNPANNSLPKEGQPRLVYTATKF